jgi:hypothetical protein
MPEKFSGVLSEHQQPRSTGFCYRLLLASATGFSYRLQLPRRINTTAYLAYRPGGGNAVRKNGYRLFEATPAILYILSKWIHRFEKYTELGQYVVHAMR